MQLLVDALGERAAHALDLRQVVDARREQPLEAAEAREQALAALGADAFDAVQNRTCACLAAPGAVALDGESMRLVADLLDEVQTGMVGRELQRVLPAGE